MSLKTIRDSYEKLLATLNEAGIKLDASQKSGLDGFILSIEESVSTQRKKAIKLAKEATERKMEKEYKEVFESIMKHTQQHYELASKIQDRLTKLNESKKLSNKVSNYLDLYLESVCPKKDIVDYAKMKKLEQINESLRDVLLANDDAVVEKKAQLEESFKKEKGKLETEVAKMQVKLNESMEKNQKLNKKLGEYKALELLESKTKDLPTFEASKIKRHFAEASAPEIEKNFKKVLEAVKTEAKKAEDDVETTLESEVNKIVDSEEVEENDMLRNRPHNGHIDDPSGVVAEAEDVDEEDFETTETVNFNEDGDVELDDDDVINESTMSIWLRNAKEEI